ncbi:MAG: DMT family transporter [Candidatus Competibacter denitrificans]
MSDRESTVSSRVVKGSLWMLAAGLLFSAMAVLVKLGARDFAAVELVFYRSVFGFVAILPGVWFKRQRLRTPYWRWHLSRSVLGTAGVFLHFFAIATLPLATAVTLTYTAPLFLTVLTLLIFRTWPGWILLSGIVLGFIGVVCLLQPTLGRELLFPALLGLIGGLCGGLAFFSTRELGHYGEPPWRVVFYFSAVATVAAGGWIWFHHPRLPSLDAVPVLLGIGASATLAQLAMTRAYKEGQVLIVGSLSYSTVAFTSLLGILLWNEWLAPSEWIGLALIVASGVIATVGSQQKSASSTADRCTAG